TTNHAALTASPRLSATIANETAPSRAIPVHKIFVCHPVVSVKMPIAVLPWCSSGLKWLAGANITTSRPRLDWTPRLPAHGCPARRAFAFEVRPSASGLSSYQGSDTLARRDPGLARTAVADDMAHVLRLGGMGEDGIRAWKDALESSALADELKAVIGRGIERVNARLADLRARYRRGAKAPPELLSPKSKATLESLRQWTAPAAGSR